MQDRFEGRSISQLRAGESAYVPDHAAWVSGGHMYLDGNFPLRGLSPMGSHTLRLVRYPDGRLACDLSAMDHWVSGVSPCGRTHNAVKVDFELVKPMRDGVFRLNDLRPGHSVWISTNDAWIWGPHMWVDGQARASHQMTEETALRIERTLEGEYRCDVSRCRGTQWRDNPQTMQNWPLQIAQAI